MKNILLHFCIILCTLLFLFKPVAAQNIPDFIVNEQVSLNGSEQTRPEISGDGNGNYVVCWDDERNGANVDIFAQIFLNNIPSGNNFRVNDDNGIHSQYKPSIAVDPNLNSVITWTDDRNDDWDIYAQRYLSDGTALGNNFKVNDDPGDEDQGSPSVSIDTEGNFVIVWADERNGNEDVYGQRYSNDGTALGDNFKINDDPGDAVQFWTVCKNTPNGGFIVSWADKRNDFYYDIYAQQFAPDGIALGNNFQVNTDPSGHFQLKPDISIDADGNFKIVWEDKRNGPYDIYFQQYTSEGLTIGENIIVDDNPLGTTQRNASISEDENGNFIICWEDDRNDFNDVYARQYSSDGNPIGNCFKVNNDSTISYQYHGEIFTDVDGDFMVVWEDHRFWTNGEIFAQAYLSDGTPVDDNFKVNNDIGTENQQRPSMAKDGSNNLIYVWVDERSDKSEVYAQRFSGDGTAIGNNFKVNDVSVNNTAIQPSVAASPDGNFVICWA